MSDDRGEVSYGEVSYEQVPFPGRPVPWSSPAALAFTSLVHGGPSLDLNTPLRVLEIGLGDGANLVPLAYFQPHMSFVGVDLSAGAIERARRAADEAGVKNVSLVHGDIETFEPDGEFDVVIAHGVYSWIDAPRRAALRRLMARALSAEGLAYVSFNALPGWSVRGRVRDALVRGRAEDLAASRARLAGLRALIGDEPANLWQATLSHELERAADASDAYLAHEYLAADNDAFWLGDVARAFESEGLSYLGDATFCRSEGHVPPELRREAERLSPDPIQREEHIDLVQFRQLHAAVFTRQRGARPSAAQVVRVGALASAARRQSDPFDVRAGMMERFDAPYGRRLEISDATLKMALLLLGDRYPAALSLGELHAACQTKLARYDTAIGPQERLAEQLAELHAELSVEIRLGRASLRHQPSAHPTATRLTRSEARWRDVLTTPLHTMLPLEPIDRAIIARLDGTRAPEQVVDSVTEAVLKGELYIEGAPSGRERLQEQVASRVSGTITTLAWWGLCA